MGTVLAFTRNSPWYLPVTVITSNADTFLWGLEGGTAQVTTALGNPTTKCPWLQATVNSWLLATKAFVLVKWWVWWGGGRSRDSTRALVAGPNPPGVVICCF